jgi:hypothetical protein
MTSEETVLQTVPPLVKASMMLGPLVVLGAILWASVEGGAGVEGALQRFGPFLLIGSMIGFMVYRVAHTIVLHDTAGTLECRTFLGARVVPARDITSITPSFLQRSQLVVRHASGSVSIPAHFAGCHDMIEWVRKRNPDVVLKGI